MAGASSEYVLGKSVLGTATKEVFLGERNVWYNHNAMMSDRDYVIRGGISRGMFYFGDISMSEIQNSSRASLKKISE